VQQLLVLEVLAKHWEQLLNGKLYVKYKILGRGMK